MLERLRQSDEALWGKKVLVVDDDARNIFALTSLLEQHGMQVVSTETGTEAISLLDQNDDIDAVLMDIMMPEMNLMQKNLEAEGHRVLMARDGPEAVQTYIRHKQEINLVVLDLDLPKLNGWEAYKMMKEADPNVKVIFATGFISPEIEAHLSTGELSAVITKPYTPTEMRKKIASGLHKPASSPL